MGVRQRTVDAAWEEYARSVSLVWCDVGCAQWIASCAAVQSRSIVCELVIACLPSLLRCRLVLSVGLVGVQSVASQRRLTRCATAVGDVEV